MPTQDATHHELELAIVLALCHQHLFVLSFVDINGFISRTRCQVLARTVPTLRPTDSLHFILVVLKLLHAIEINRIVGVGGHSPNGGGAIETAAGEEVALRTPLDTPDGLGVSIQDAVDADPFLLCHSIRYYGLELPNFDCFVGAG
jgi:hypothetical protein